MKRVGLVVAYDGTNYSGWQIQPNGITIQGVLNDALTDLLGEKCLIRIHAFQEKRFPMH